MIEPLSNRVVAVVSDLATPTGPNLTCTHIPDIAYHVAVVDVVVYEVKILIGFWVKCFQLFFPFRTFFAHIVAFDVLLGNEGHLVG